MSDPYVLFHVTPLQNMAKIAKEGILPPASLSLGTPMTGFVGDITNADAVAILEVEWMDDVAYYLDPDGPGYLHGGRW